MTGLAEQIARAMYERRYSEGHNWNVTVFQHQFISAAEFLISEMLLGVDTDVLKEKMHAMVDGTERAGRIVQVGIDKYNELKRYD